MVPAVSGSCEQMRRDAQAACDTLGRATVDWPDAAGMLGRPRPRTTRESRAAAAAANRLRADERRSARLNERSRRTKHTRASHTWAAVGQGKQRCVDCLSWDHTGIEKCPGATTAWAARIDDAIDRGHVLQRGLLHDAGCGTPLHILACVKCGSFTTGIKLLGLADDCHHPTPAGRAAIARMAAGKNPKPGRSPAWYAQCR